MVQGRSENGEAFGAGGERLTKWLESSSYAAGIMLHLQGETLSTVRAPVVVGTAKVVLSEFLKSNTTAPGGMERVLSNLRGVVIDEVRADWPTRLCRAKGLNVEEPVL